MSKAYISVELREKIAKQAKKRCGYCLTPEAIVGTAMEAEHIIPESAGGLTVEENLWLACSTCNKHKKDRLKIKNPDTGKEIDLFNPRQQLWSEHFSWSEDGTKIIGITDVGKVTVVALNLNRKLLVDARRLWVRFNLHPPKD